MHSYAITQLLKHKIYSEYTAGHSLGEYTALVYSGALDFESGLKLVKIRGELMQKAGEQQKGTMAAIVGIDEEVINSICEEASAAGIVQVANFNSPGQIVISGSVAGVQKAIELAKAKNAKMAKELVVHGAFHSPLMEPARKELKKALDDTEFNTIMIPVYANVTAEALNPLSSPEEIKKSLCNQLTSPVRWQQSVEQMIKDGADEFIELGPGKVLQGLIKRIDTSVQFKGYDKIKDLELVKV